MNKPRLIDANALLDDLALEPVENRTYWRANEIVLAQPTAYDTDKIVAELCKKTHRVETYQYGREAVIGLADAIEIVKGGAK